MILPLTTSILHDVKELNPSCAMERTPVGPWLLTPLERFLLSCDTASSPMMIRVVLRFTGNCCVDQLRDSLQRAIVRHPLLSCRLGKATGRPAWIFGEPEPVKVTRTSGTVFETETGPVTNTINLNRSTGLHAEIRELDNGVKVFLDAHHAVTDGNGLRQMITDWLHLYHCGVTGTAIRLPVLDPNRLARRDCFPQPAAVSPISLREAVRNFLLTVRGRTARWMRIRAVTMHAPESWRGYSVEQILTVEQSDRLHEKLAAWKVTLNDLVLACCMSTFAGVAPGVSNSHRITIMNPTDLRMPSDRSLPAANRFGIAFLRRRPVECIHPEEILRGLQDEMSYVRSNYIGAEFLKGLAAASRYQFGIALIRRLGFFVPSMQWTCLGDVTRGAKRLLPWKNGVLSTGGLTLESATGFAPCAPGVPLSVAACETGRRIALTVHSSPIFLTDDETRTFAEKLLEQICEFEEHPC